jgi:hypothetical protein
MAEATSDFFMIPPEVLTMNKQTSVNCVAANRESMKQLRCQLILPRTQAPKSLGKTQLPWQGVQCDCCSPCCSTVASRGEVSQLLDMRGLDLRVGFAGADGLSLQLPTASSFKQSSPKNRHILVTSTAGYTSRAQLGAWVTALGALMWRNFRYGCRDGM